MISSLIKKFRALEISNFNFRVLSSINSIVLLVGFLSKWNEDKKTELLLMALFLIGVIWTFQVFYLVNRPVKFKIQAVSFLLMTFFSSLFYILFGIKEAFWLEIALLQNISQFSLSSKKMGRCVHGWLRNCCD